jgi:hypothetical protein
MNIQIKVINANTLATMLNDTHDVETKPDMTVVTIKDASPFQRSYVLNPQRTCQGDVYLLKYDGLSFFSQLVTATMKGKDAMLRFEHISDNVA